MTVLADQKRGRNNEVTGKLLLRVSLLVPVYLNTEFSVASEFFVPDRTPDSFGEFLFKNAKLLNGFAVFRDCCCFVFPALLAKS